MRSSRGDRTFEVIIEHSLIGPQIYVAVGEEIEPPTFRLTAGPCTIQLPHKEAPLAGYRLSGCARCCPGDPVQSHIFCQQLAVSSSDVSSELIEADPLSFQTVTRSSSPATDDTCHGETHCKYAISAVTFGIDEQRFGCPEARGYSDLRSALGSRPSALLTLSMVVDRTHP